MPPRIPPATFLSLPHELRHQIYTHLLPHPLLAYLGIKSHGPRLYPFFTIERRRLKDDRSYIPSRMWESLDLRVLLVCKQIYDEVVALLGEKMGMDITLLDSNERAKGREKAEEIIRDVVPRWFVERVRTVRCYSDSEDVKGCLHQVFSALKTVVLHDRVSQSLREIVGNTRWELHDVEKAEVLGAVRERAVMLFKEKVAGFDEWGPERRFRIVREIKFGRFHVLATVGSGSPARSSRWIVGHTFDVKVSENVEGPYSVDMALAPSLLELQKIAPEQCHWEDESGYS